MIGTRINNYEITGLIGAGGMGNVYLARHPLIDRGAAIKVLHAELANDRGLVTRFFNEARAANAIRHPNIIDIIDVGFLPGTERPYLMMELLEGESLAQRIARQGQLSPSHAIELARQTASALAAAHRKGIIHRDLKPENLFVVPHGSMPGREEVKVLDFGIAKLRSEVGDGKFQTQAGMLMGTPPYMSPEQCRGVSAEIDARTDIYALGVILFEMLCGAPPFNAAGMGELLVMHITRPPPAPRSLNPNVPEPLEAIVLKALAKGADERFATMTDFEVALGTSAATLASMPVASAVAASPVVASAATPVLAETPLTPVPATESGRHTPPRPTSSPTSPITTIGGSVMTMSADLEAIGHKRSRLWLVFAGAIGVGAVIFVLSGISTSTPNRASDGSQGAHRAAEPTAVPKAVTAPPANAPATADAGAPPATSASASSTPVKSVTRKATRPKPAPRPDPEKW